MGCDCCVKTAGYAAVAFVAYRLITALYNIVFPYLLAGTIDLKKRAGANWAVVTGATDGIGKAYAFELASRGFNVLIISRTQSKLDDTKKEILDKYNTIEVRTFAFDFTAGSTDAYKPLFDVLNSLEVGILINNVGLSYEYPEILHKVDGGLERLGAITVINTLPPTLLTGAVIPQMLSRNTGVIVNVSSYACYNQMSMWAVYSATKKYVTWLTGILRKEYGSQGLTIQTICPMLVATKMSKVKKTSLFAPNGSQFAKSAVNTIGNAVETTGYITHQLQAEFMGFLPDCVFDFILAKINKGTRAAALRKKAREAKSQ